MTLKYYHAEPLANSLKSMIPPLEKDLPWQSVTLRMRPRRSCTPWTRWRGKSARPPGLPGDAYTLADINFFSYWRVAVERMFPEMQIGRRCPRLVAWGEKMRARPAVKRALAGEDRTVPGLRTWSGEAR